MMFVKAGRLMDIIIILGSEALVEQVCVKPGVKDGYISSDIVVSEASCVVFSGDIERSLWGSMYADSTVNAVNIGCSTLESCVISPLCCEQEQREEPRRTHDLLNYSLTSRQMRRGWSGHERRWSIWRHLVRQNWRRRVGGSADRRHNSPGRAWHRKTFSVSLRPRHLDNKSAIQRVTQ